MTGEVYAHQKIIRFWAGDAGRGAGGRRIPEGVEAARGRAAGNSCTSFQRAHLGFSSCCHLRNCRVLSALIGSEILTAAPRADDPHFGSNALTERYGRAADALGISWSRGPERSVVAGHLLIARAAGLLGSVP